MHVSAYVIVACIVGFNPWVLGFWGLALAGHAIRSFPALVGLYRHYLRGQPLALQVPAAAAVGSEAPTVPPASTYLAELEQALDALAAALDANDSVRMDPSEFEDIRARARALHLQRIALREVANDDAMARLEAELMDAQHNADQAQDERSAAVYEAEARAILGRLQTMKDAAAAADRIRARERTLLHELEGARLQLLRAGVHEEPLPELVAQLARVKGELEAEAEVDAKLAEAQRVAGAAAPEGVQAGTPTADGEAARRQAAARQSAKRQGLG
jgi:hypothetical protein